jgi:penicillin amidase
MSDSPPTAEFALQAERERLLKRRWTQILLFVAGGFFLVLMLAAVTGVLCLRAVAKAALPQLDGNVQLAGLSAPVTVRRDAHGVPHIEAVTQADLFVAQGYVTAQDRLWQMDASRRAANGNLAEILGPHLAKNDKTQRVLQIRITAQRIYSRMPAVERRVLDDYARGVNLDIAQCEKNNTLPPEFRLLGYRPEPWTGVDSVSVGLMMVETLDLRVTTKLMRARVQARLNDPRLSSDLYPVGSWRDHPPTGVKIAVSAPLPRTPSQDTDDDDDDNTEARAAPAFTHSPFAPEDPAAMQALEGRSGCEDCVFGSNNWVVAGAHTASGKPLLANDMHLTLRVPDTWYIADLRAAGFHAAGVTLPGLPLVVAGHNEHVAWGYTALYADVEDLYTEKLDGKGNYEGPDAQWHPLAVDREVIHVRGGRDVVVNVESTGHGPLLNPLLAHGDPPLALKWTLYDPTLDALPLYEMNTASNWAEFSAALQQWCWPAQNLVYADDQGHIAYHAIGKVSLRPDGLARLHTLQPDAALLRSALGISGHGQLARNDGQVAVPTHR